MNDMEENNVSFHKKNKRKSQKKNGIIKLVFGNLNLKKIMKGTNIIVCTILSGFTPKILKLSLIPVSLGGIKRRIITPKI